LFSVADEQPGDRISQRPRGRTGIVMASATRRKAAAVLQPRVPLSRRSSTYAGLLLCMESGTGRDRSGSPADLRRVRGWPPISRSIADSGSIHAAYDEERQLRECHCQRRRSRLRLALRAALLAASGVSASSMDSLPGFRSPPRTLWSGGRSSFASIRSTSFAQNPMPQKYSASDEKQSGAGVGTNVA
jgi:hypothetical protein